MSIDTNDADLPASVPMQDWPPGPAEAIEFVTTTWASEFDRWTSTFASATDYFKYLS